MHGALLMRVTVTLVKIGCKQRLGENKLFGVIVGAINDVVDATRIMEVTGREKSRGILKAGSKRESGLAPLSGGRLPVKMEIRINDEETKRKESRKRR